ncbi:MAG TPA: cytochrome d ubiquinol oxidase subunit II [Candidatus Limnocylindrales bacterium]
MLHEIWFLLIAVLWIGYFVLEGFDFGLGILLPFIGRNDGERRQLINAIGPVWDGNEVWLLVAGGATFAAFPNWYATLFSGFYLALFSILIALILRGVAFEYRGKHDSARWRLGWDWAIFIGSAVPALLWGVAFANIVAGVPIDKNMEYTGSLLTLLNPFGILGGVVTLTLFMTHGAAYIALKTEGVVRERANKLVLVIGLVAAVAAVALLGWLEAKTMVTGAAVVSVLAAVSLLSALLANRLRSEGLAFVGTALAIGLAVVALFLHLYPNVMPSSTDPAFNLTVTNASSTDYTLQIMTVVAVIFTPLVLLYQGWTYWIFRKRISSARVPDAAANPGSAAHN